MSYDLYNGTRATRIIYDGMIGQKEIRVAPKQAIRGIELSDAVARDLFRNSGNDDLTIELHDPNRPVDPEFAKPAIVLDGRFGIGDAIHQRGVVKELMRTHEVWLHTCHFRVYQDLVERGLKLIFKGTRLHAQAKTIERERALFPHAPPPPNAAPRFNLSYNKELIDRHGSILEAMASCASVKVRPLDFALPVRLEWVEAFKARFSWNTGGKPIMVYRPIVLRPEWNGANRNPDPEAYSAIFRAIRDGFFVVSVGDFEPNREWIVGPEEDADVKLHKGELSFEDMAALWSSAAIVFCNAGFAPVLAQAVGAPSIVVYGGRESYRTTQRAGEHLAPTLGVDADRPCDCHTEKHDCGDKRITLPPAIERAKAFAEKHRQAQRGRPQGVGDPQADEDRAADKILIFATTYVDSGDREKLTRQWLDLHVALNQDCDFLIVDSASPKPVLDPEWAARFKAEPQKFRFFDFGDNVGHLSRKGRDGWGRAFCRGLDYAAEHGYDYVLHIEGDSLLRVPARDIVAQMKTARREVASIPVKGTSREIPGWVETGLMLFSTVFLRRTGFTARYNWPIREVRPTPEFVVPDLIGRGETLMLDLKGLRGDKNQISADNIVKLDLDWVTHVHNDIWVYEAFVKANLPNFARIKSAGESQVSIGTKSEQQGNVSLLSPCSSFVAVIVGGARTVWDEIGQTKLLSEAAGARLAYFVINDMIPLFEGPCIAVTLHAQKLRDHEQTPGWLDERERNGFPKPDQVWTHVKHRNATHFTEDWRGSSGLFAIKVARQLGFERIVLCGVPMRPEAGHIVRGATPWNACEQFMGGWKQQAKEIAPYVRSWFGWTAEQFGKPDRAFLDQMVEA
jgi:hypothetical protein